MSNNNNFRVEGWLIEPELLSITHPNKGKYTLQSKVMQVLLALLKAENQVVSKQSLMDQVWQDLVITENSLNQAISELRKIFGDSRKTPLFIETIPTKGYRFVAKVEPTSDTLTKKPSNHQLSVTLFSKIIIGVALSLFVLLALNWYKQSDEKLNLAVAPNGQSIAYFIEQSNGFYMHIKSTDETSVPQTVFIKRPETLAMGWSSDSSKIVYNATLSEDTYFSMNVFDLSSGKTKYYKAAKIKGRHKQDSLPENFNKPTGDVVHEEFNIDGQVVDRIEYSKGEYFSAYFVDGKITSFSWQSISDIEN